MCHFIYTFYDSTYVIDFKCQATGCGNLVVRPLALKPGDLGSILKSDV